jgi:hypothetical protein
VQHAPERELFVAGEIAAANGPNKLGVQSETGIKPDIPLCSDDVCFTPESGHSSARSRCPLCAKSGLPHRSKLRLYSITSSARASSEGGTLRPSALAVLRLITRSNYGSKADIDGDSCMSAKCHQQTSVSPIGHAKVCGSKPLHRPAAGYRRGVGWQRRECIIATQCATNGRF